MQVSFPYDDRLVEIRRQSARGAIWLPAQRAWEMSKETMDGFLASVKEAGIQAVICADGHVVHGELPKAPEPRKWEVYEFTPENEPRFGEDDLGRPVLELRGLAEASDFETLQIRWPHASAKIKNGRMPLIGREGRRLDQTEQREIRRWVESVLEHHRSAILNRKVTAFEGEIMASHGLKALPGTDDTSGIPYGTKTVLGVGHLSIQIRDASEIFAVGERRSGVFGFVREVIGVSEAFPVPAEIAERYGVKSGFGRLVYDRAVDEN